MGITPTALVPWSRPGVPEPRHADDQVTGRAWGEKGKTPVVLRSGNRFSVNAMSAISTKGRMHFTVFVEGSTAEVMRRFLERLAAHPGDIEPRFPSTYSPELNPDEPVNPADVALGTAVVFRPAA